MNELYMSLRLKTSAGDWGGWVNKERQVSNPLHGARKLRKAGQSRWLGRRPIVRGVAMNPVDHPHGGGEGPI